MLEALLATTKRAALDPSTSLLMHFDGANGSQSFVEETGKVVAFEGAAALSTAQKKFGTSALGFTTNYNDLIYVPNSVDLQLSGDFTIEFQSYLNSFSNYDSIPFSKCSRDNNAYTRSYLEFYQGIAYLKLDGVSPPGASMSAAGALKAGQWQHVALTRKTNQYSLWVDGALAGSRALAYPFGVNDGLFVIGNMSGTVASTPFVFNGKIDEFRVTKGRALYTAPFTPPSAPFTT